MIRIQVPDRATADRIIAALYMAAVDDLWPTALEAP